MPGPSLTLAQVLAVTGGQLLTGDPERLSRPIHQICTDSRSVRPGDLFVAFRGERFDGHQFVRQAFEAGAAGVLVDTTYRDLLSAGSSSSGPGELAGCLLAVSDTVTAYQDLAASHRRHFDIPIVAVTGSNGKTTTKDMVARVLEERWQVLVTEGNLNNRIGVPQTLLRLTPRHQAAVIEMGVDRAGQTTRLVEIARPTIGIITNIGPDHLEFFGTLQASADAKGELLDHSPDQIAVLNADDPYFGYLAAKAQGRIISFGLAARADVRATDVTPNADGMAFRLRLPGRIRPTMVALPAHGFHNLANALAAAAVGHVCNLSGAKIADGLARFRPASMRTQVETLEGVQVINDCYNANPASMRAALDLLVELGQGARTVAILGDMLELGPRASTFHHEVGAHAALRDISMLVACGSLAPGFLEGAREAGMSEERLAMTSGTTSAAAWVVSHIRPGDVVLIKGSRGMRMEQVVEALRDRAASVRTKPAASGGLGR